MYQYKNYLNNLYNSDKYRKLGTFRQDFLDFSTNDYLNLSKNQQVIKSAIDICKQYGVGSTGSRLLSGNSEIYEEFENIIAIDKNTNAGLIFNSGFQANLSILSCILDEKILKTKPIVFFDKLNHISLYQGTYLSKAEMIRYNHNDMNHLEFILEKYKNDNRPKFIITETVFGMDGDIVNLAQIAEFAKKYNAFLYLDEAHATGVFGINGYGISTYINLEGIQHIIMGTFSKAIGSSGAYIACDNIMRNFLINKATGFIYSTSLPPMVIGASMSAWKIVKLLQNERNNLQNLGYILRNKLKNLDFNIGTATTHIVPVILKEEKLCIKIKEELLKEKITVSCIRPPAVPTKTSRLRIALTLSHTLADLDKLVDILHKIVK